MCSLARLLKSFSEIEKMEETMFRVIWYKYCCIWYCYTYTCCQKYMLFEIFKICCMYHSNYWSKIIQHMGMYCMVNFTTISYMEWTIRLNILVNFYSATYSFMWHTLLSNILCVFRMYCMDRELTNVGLLNGQHKQNHPQKSSLKK